MTASRRHVVIVGCSARKLATATPVPALELYQGWCIPQLRAHAHGHPTLRAAVLVLSGQHGLIGADTSLLPYDQPLTPARAAALREDVHRALVEQLQPDPACEVLLLLTAAYLELLTPALLACPPAVAHWIPDPVAHWSAAAAVLTTWGWPTPPGDGGAR